MSETITPANLWGGWERLGYLPFNTPPNFFESWLTACQTQTGSPTDIWYRPWVQAFCYHALGLDDQVRNLWPQMVAEKEPPFLGWQLLVRIALRRGQPEEAVALALRGLAQTENFIPEDLSTLPVESPRAWPLLSLLLQALLYAGESGRGLEIQQRLPDKLWEYTLADDIALDICLVTFLLGQHQSCLDRMVALTDTLYQRALGYRSDLVPLVLLMYAVTDLLRGNLSGAAGRLERAYEHRQSLNLLGRQSSLSWLDEALTYGWRLVSPFSKAPTHLRHLPTLTYITSLSRPLHLFFFILDTMGRMFRRLPVERQPTPEESRALPSWLRFLGRLSEADLPGALRGWELWYHTSQRSDPSPLDRARLESWLGNMGELGQALRQQMRHAYHTQSVQVCPQIDSQQLSPEQLLQVARLSRSSAWVRQGGDLALVPSSDETLDVYLTWEREREHPPDWLVVETASQAMGANGVARLLLEAWQLRQRLNLAEDEILNLSRRLAPAIIQPPSGDDGPPLPLTIPLLGVSEPIRKLREMLRTLHVNQSILPVLIMGETGTGKEVVARALHDVSPRAKNRFLPLNCAGFSRELLASELFGHVKGAFTGAHENRLGAIREAENGTIFLDEIGEMPIEQQPVLLRWLESGEVRPVGSSQSYRSNARLIAATNRDLVQMVKEKLFRDDLLARLSVLVIRLPPLRERPEDIPILANYFLGILRKGATLTQACLDYLVSYRWPGNVRELRSVLQRTVALLPPDVEVIDVGHLQMDKPVSRRGRRPSGELSPAASTGEAVPETETSEDRCLVDLSSYVEEGNYRGGIDAAGMAMLNKAFQRYGVWERAYQHFRISRITLIRLRKRFQQSEQERPAPPDEKASGSTSGPLVSSGPRTRPSKGRPRMHAPIEDRTQPPRNG